jgi:hypothetical protein
LKKPVDYDELINLIAEELVKCLALFVKYFWVVVEITKSFAFHLFRLNDHMIVRSMLNWLRLTWQWVRTIIVIVNRNVA